VRGEAAALLAADLQDPPEVLDGMVARWRDGAQVVWAARRTRPGEKAHAGFAAIYWWVMRHVVGMKEIPARGADVFLLAGPVIDAFRRFPERHVSVFALITWLGFRQEFIEYDKQPRASGKSGWTRARKIKLVVDSVTAFTEAPIRACSYLGGGLLGVGVLIAILAAARFAGGRSAGHVALLAAMTGLTGLQLLALGVVGEYVWRALEESRRRPPYLIEAATLSAGSTPSRDAG
jgi:dolichol-phosphate mannosyltransferase